MAKLFDIVLVMLAPVALSYRHSVQEGGSSSEKASLVSVMVLDMENEIKDLKEENLKLTALLAEKDVIVGENGTSLLDKAGHAGTGHLQNFPDELTGLTMKLTDVTGKLTYHPAGVSGTKMMHSLRIGIKDYRASWKQPVTVEAISALFDGATHFAYVHHPSQDDDPNVYVGGFVYFKGEDVVQKTMFMIEASATSSTGPEAMLFGAPLPISKKSAAELAEGGDRWFPITAGPLWDGGARRYAWVMPGDVGGPNGGFLYDFVNPTDLKIFQYAAR